MVNINVPAQAATAMPTDKALKMFYFGTILRKPKVDALTGSLGQRNSVSPADDDMKPPIAGVRLGPLLGKGSFGSVHYGTWNGAQIAVKVRCNAKQWQCRQPLGQSVMAIASACKCM